MFGVRYAKSATAAWHADVETWDLFDAQSGEPLGRFYLDMHPREGKYKHAAMFPVTSGVEGIQLPEAALVCNFPQAKGNEPALLEHDDVKTFFHEFGHLLHHLLGGRQKWVGVSGIKTEWDFVEAPSQMLEEWVFDLDTLRTFAKHVETGEPVPADLVKAMRAASDFGKGLQVRHQMYYAKLSLELYRRDPAAIDTTALSRELMNRYSPFRYVDETRFEASFGHLDGYSAIYYTYMWSLVIAKDLFSDFKKRGLLDPEVAARYRRAVLAPGGSRDASELVESFLGRPVSFSSFETWLNESG
jgi:thimet oligopeptidase